MQKSTHNVNTKAKSEPIKPNEEICKTSDEANTLLCRGRRGGLHSITQYVSIRWSTGVDTVNINGDSTGLDEGCSKVFDEVVDAVVTIM